MTDGGSVESGLRERIAQLSEENAHLRREVEKLQRDLQAARSAQEGIPKTYDEGIFAEAYMRPRLREEICRAGRYRHYLSFLAVQLLPQSKESLKRSAGLAHDYAYRMRDLLRATDILFLTKDGRLSIILPETSEAETARVIDRLQNLLDGQVKMACAVASYPHDANHEAALIAEASDRLDRLVASWNA